ncbi:V-type ATP synthase subunit D [Borreliella burgdorferi]|uniref:V-type ATP synthase subunit D n=1 Tax=Borreliella burgdorferi TaxID=139 RepID=UPI001C389A48|nr:V-type ATP synthase subunit D [Borreliella burgdorferi]QXG43829.1 V-type ATP synthase subunit D [Borreliella burgdorferi]WNY60768.1 V-type ATP synthase subunit D [Borreliella burgdorferi]
MSKIKLTKNDLKKQKDELKMFKRYLPTLQLKKQQLYMEIVKIENSYKIKNLEQQKLKENISNWISLFSEKFPFESWIQVKIVVKKSLNIAGVAIPIFDSIEYEDIRHDLLFTPYWVDKGIEILKVVIQIDVELKILKKQIDLLLREFRITSQRVNLFEKVMIPTAKANIKKINIYLGDQQTAAVVRGKIAKSSLIKKNRNSL